MSGFSGNCIACGKKRYLCHGGCTSLKIHDKLVIACDDCIPYAPKMMTKTCSVCGEAGVGLCYPDTVDDYDIKNAWTCQCCKDAIKHKELHERMEKL